MDVKPTAEKLKWIKDKFDLTLQQIEDMTDEEHHELLLAVMSLEADAIEFNKPQNEIDFICSVTDLIANT